MSLLQFAGSVLDGRDPQALGEFWAGVLGWEATRDGADVVLRPSGQGDHPIRLQRADTPKRRQNTIHLDLTSASQEAMQHTIERALRLGGRRLAFGQTPDEGHEVLADPEGNELCVIQPGNGFLAGTGTVGALNCDGTRALGHFWNRVLQWPLVWDDVDAQETAIQSPSGGSKITWSGPPLLPRGERNRWCLAVSPAPGIGSDDAVHAFLDAGGTLPDGLAAAEQYPGRRALLDPDGNEVRLLPATPSDAQPDDAHPRI